MSDERPARSDDSGGGSAPAPAGTRTLARYRLLEEVGRGGMAVVHRALDPTLGREVAVKVLHPHLAGEPESRARLEREAQAVAKLRHENILEIHDYSGADSADSFLVTEFIHGPTLTGFLAKHRIPLPEVAAMVASEVARGLEHAHRFGVIHRDVKPENVMIRDDGRVKITDFGIAQIVDKERLTATGQLIGSPAYMSPEIVTGGRVDFRTDVFAVGILLYQLATGAMPFPGRNPHEVMKKIAEGRFAPADAVNPLVGTQLARIVARALARVPDDRYPDMGALRGDLDAWLAAAGIDDPRAELGRYFAAPEAWADEARPKIVAALVEHGRREASRGRTAAAVALGRRALALSPKDPSARALLDGIARRRRLGRAASTLGGALVLAALALVAAHHRPPAKVEPSRSTVEPSKSTVEPSKSTVEPSRSTVEPSRSTVEPSRSTVEPSRSTGEPSRSTVEPSRSMGLPATATAGVVRGGRHAAGGHPAPEASREVSLNVVPKNVEILVDGRSRGSWVPGAPLVVGPGKHTLEFRHEPFCFPVSVELPAEARAIPDVRLPWRRGYLTVRTVPAAAELVVKQPHRERVTARPGVPLAIPIPEESPNGQERVRVTAVADGYPTREVEIEVTAGMHADRTIDLTAR